MILISDGKIKVNLRTLQDASVINGYIYVFLTRDLRLVYRNLRILELCYIFYINDIGYVKRKDAEILFLNTENTNETERETVLYDLSFGSSDLPGRQYY